MSNILSENSFTSSAAFLVPVLIKWLMTLNIVSLILSAIFSVSVSLSLSQYLVESFANCILPVINIFSACYCSKNSLP
jgi:hypothetical protein